MSTHTPTDDASVEHRACGNLSFLLSVIRCGGQLSPDEETVIHRTMELLDAQRQHRAPDLPRGPLIQPLPWHVEPDGAFSKVVDCQGVAVFGGVTPDEAAFIVAACHACSRDALTAEGRSHPHDEICGDGVRLVGVDSSHIRAAGWTQHRLRVRFTTGILGEYNNVSEAWFRAFLAAPSKGKFLVGLKRDPASYPWRTIYESDSRPAPEPLID